MLEGLVPDWALLVFVGSGEALALSAVGLGEMGEGEDLGFGVVVFFGVAFGVAFGVVGFGVAGFGGVYLGVGAGVGFG